MSLLVVCNKKNPSRRVLDAAYSGWSSTWGLAVKVEFYLFGDDRLQMSVMRLDDEKDGLTITGFTESGERVEVAMNSATGTGIVTTLPSVAKAPYNFVQA
jgi:hypothetical protein